MRMPPIATSCQYALTPRRFSPLRMLPRISAPTSAFQTPPRPPKKLAPPMMTAEIASSSVSWPALGKPELVRPATMMPPTAAHDPLRT